MAFLPRERVGVIVVACIVGVGLCIGPLADRFGCRRVPEVATAEVASSDSVRIEADSMATASAESVDTADMWGKRKFLPAAERSEAHRQSDSIRKRQRLDSAALRKSSSTREKRRRSNAPKDPQRRSLRDETL
ncbi:MAG: hypothetical protein K2L83_09055 [Muribaculaceae bacterium]|nr:hypothetical protein [Muribaculaceae bacterium]